MKKKLISKVLAIAMTLCMVITIIPSIAFAETNVNESTLIDSGTCGENLTWELTESGILTISGTGGMTDYTVGRWNKPDEGSSPWIDYVNKIKKLVIEEGVTSIGNAAFWNCSEIKGNLIIPESVTSIGDWAFYNCWSLTGNLIISESVTSIGEGAFSDCYGFTGDLIIPSNMKTIEESTFYNCVGFDGELILPEGLEVIEEDAFFGCYITGKLNLPSTITSIGNSAFSSCVRITGELVIPENTNYIGRSAFYWCKKIESVTIPESVTYIGYNAFGWSTENLLNVKYEGDKTSWDTLKKENLNYCIVHYNDCSKFDCTGWVRVKKANLKSDGHKYYTCKSCGVRYDENISRIAKISWPKAKWTYDTFKANGNNSYRSMLIKASNGRYINSSKYRTVTFKTMNGKEVKGYVPVGKYKCVLTFKGDYEGVHEKVITILPNATTISSIKAGNDSFTVKWNKRTEQVTGYQVRYSISSKFNSYTTKTITNNKTVSKTYKGLKNKKTYYVKVRTYKTVNGQKYYSDWSKMKSIKTK